MSERRSFKESSEDWIPKTRLGKMVQKGEITTMAEALRTGLPLREAEIVDVLLPDLEDEVLDVNMVQRMTDSGRRVSFTVVTVVGNRDGYVGVAKAKGKEVGPTIRKAIDVAKLSIIEIRRGCGSWECGCGTPHSLPFAFEGKSSSVVTKFKPSPRGIGLAVASVPKHILSLAGVKDAWGFTRGHTRTTINYAFSTYNALKNGASTRTTDQQKRSLNITTGPIMMVSTETSSVDETLKEIEKAEKKEGGK